jgi:hypothetical protein
VRLLISTKSINKSLFPTNCYQMLAGLHSGHNSGDVPLSFTYKPSDPGEPNKKQLSHRHFRERHKATKRDTASRRLMQPHNAVASASLPHPPESTGSQARRKRPTTCVRISPTDACEPSNESQEQRLQKVENAAGSCTPDPTRVRLQPGLFRGSGKSRVYPEMPPKLPGDMPRVGSEVSQEISGLPRDDWQKTRGCYFRVFSSL